MKWFALRIAPLGLRLGPEVVDADTGEIRRLFRLEAELTAAGIEHYLPSETKFLQHNRTKEWFDRRFPLMGYCFVANITDWPRLERNCRDHYGPVRVARVPVQIPEREVERVRQAQLQIDTGHALMHRNRQLTKRRLAELYPAGSEVEITSGPLAQQRATVLFATGRQAIKALVTMLGSEVPVELGVDQIREAAQ